MNPNIPNLIMMVRPLSFGFNEQTAASNSFQNSVEIDKVAEKAQAEFDQAVQTFRSKNIKVNVFDDLKEGLPDSVFPNNWISHIPKGPIVTYPMLTENRRAEVRPDIIHYLKNTVMAEEHIDLTQEAKNDLFLEGTGSIVFNHENKTAYACVSPRTNLKLLSKLCSKIGYKEVSFESVDLKGQQIYHTNVMMSIGHKVILVCLESIPDTIEQMMLSESLKSTGKTIVELSYPQVNAFAGNALEVASRDGNTYYIMSTTAFNALYEHQRNLVSTDAEIIAVDIPTIETVGGGSIRCMLTGFYNYPR